MTLFEPVALRAHRLFESRDVDHTREAISAVMQPHALLPLGRPAHGRAHMDFVRVGGIGIGTIAFGEPMRVTVEYLEGYHLLMFCLRGRADAASGAARFHAGPAQGVLLAPGQPFSADCSADCEQLVLRLDSSAVLAHGGEPHAAWQPRLALQAPALQPLIALLQGLTTAPALLDAACTQALVAADVERLLVHLLLAAQAPRLDGRADSGIAPACVRRAEAYIEAHLALPLRLGDIAAAAGVPVRTLHDAFVRFRDISPMQHVQQWRLDRARALLQQQGETARIAQVALECGFAHFGRFAQAYRRRHGESPSQTLARLRGV